MSKAEEINNYQATLDNMISEYLSDNDNDRAECTLQAIDDTLKYMRNIIVSVSNEEKFFDKK